MPDDRKTKKSATPARPASQPDEVAQAFARTEADILALPKERVGQVTTDVPTAVSLALGALPQIESLLADMKDVLKKPPVDELARLRDRALATLYAHLHFVPRTKSLETDLEEARVLRERLLTTADAHVSHGHFDAESIAKIREGAGSLDRANDLIALGALFRSAWDDIGERTPVTLAQLERASALGTQLVIDLGGRALGVTAVTGGESWSDLRTRAFRLLVEDYDEIRRAVEYVRYHEGDAAAYAPSLHTRPRQPSREKPSEPEGGESPRT